MALVWRQREQFFETLEHFADVQRRREWPLARQVFVEMADIRGEHDKTPASPDPNELQSGRMTAGRMDRQAGREFGITVVEHDAARIIEPHESADILDLERMRQPRIPHVAARGISHFA